MLDIHTIVPFRVIRAIAPHWREAAKAEKAEGKEVFRKIVNVSSISGTMGNAGPGQLLVREGRRRRDDEDARQGVGRVQDQRATRRVRVHRDAPHPGEGEGRDDRDGEGEKVALGIPEQMRSMAAMVIPLGRPAQPGGGGRAGAVPRSELVELRPRPGPQRHRRPVRRDVHLGRVRGLGAAVIAVAAAGADQPAPTPRRWSSRALTRGTSVRHRDRGPVRRVRHDPAPIRVLEQRHGHGRGSGGAFGGERDRATGAGAPPSLLRGRDFRLVAGGRPLGVRRLGRDRRARAADQGPDRRRGRRRAALDLPLRAVGRRRGLAGVLVDRVEATRLLALSPRSVR